MFAVIFTKSVVSYYLINIFDHKYAFYTLFYYSDHFKHIAVKNNSCNFLSKLDTVSLVQNNNFVCLLLYIMLLVQSDVSNCMVKRFFNRPHGRLSNQC